MAVLADGMPGSRQVLPVTLPEIGRQPRHMVSTEGGTLSLTQTARSA